MQQKTQHKTPKAVKQFRTRKPPHSKPQTIPTPPSLSTSQAKPFLKNPTRPLHTTLRLKTKPSPFLQQSPSTTHSCLTITSRLFSSTQTSSGFGIPLQNNHNHNTHNNPIDHHNPIHSPDVNSTYNDPLRPPPPSPNSRVIKSEFSFHPDNIPIVVDILTRAGLDNTETDLNILKSTQPSSPSPLLTPSMLLKIIIPAPTAEFQAARALFSMRFSEPKTDAAIKLLLLAKEQTLSVITLPIVDIVADLIKIPRKDLFELASTLPPHCGVVFVDENDIEFHISADTFVTKDDKRKNSGHTPTPVSTHPHIHHNEPSSFHHVPNKVSLDDIMEIVEAENHHDDDIIHHPPNSDAINGVFRPERNLFSQDEVEKALKQAKPNKDFHPINSNFASNSSAPSLNTNPNHKAQNKTPLPRQTSPQTLSGYDSSRPLDLSNSPKLYGQTLFGNEENNYRRSHPMGNPVPTTHTESKINDKRGDKTLKRETPVQQVFPNLPADDIVLEVDDLEDETVEDDAVEDDAESVSGEEHLEIIHPVDWLETQNNPEGLGLQTQPQEQLIPKKVKVRVRTAVKERE